MDLFGRKKKAPPPPRVADTIASLRDAQLMLEKKERHIDKQAAQCREDAKAKLRAKDKRGALFLIKRAKLYEQQIHQLYGKRSNLDIQIMALEGAAINTETFKVMDQGRAALKAATKAVDVDVVSDVMEDINESIQMNEEINDALAQQIGPQMDEQELEDELKEMEQEMVDKDLLTVNALPEAAPTRPLTTTASSAPRERQREEKAPGSVVVPSLPARPLVTAGGGGGAAPPKAKPHAVDEKEAKELKELEAMMGM